MTIPDTPSKKTSPVVWFIIVPLAVGLTVLLVDKLTPSAEFPPSGSSQQINEDTEDAAGSDDPIGSQPAEEIPVVEAAFAPQSIEVSDRVDSSRCEIPNWSGYDWEDSAPQIAGIPHPTGFQCTVSYANTVGFQDFLVPVGAKRLSVVAGQADTARNTTLVMRFEVLNTTTGAVLSTSDLAFGQQVSIDLDLSGVARVTLRASMLTYVTAPKEESGIAAWGDPTFR